MCVLLPLPPPRSTLFPYTTLFRSAADGQGDPDRLLERLLRDRRPRVCGGTRSDGRDLQPDDRARGPEEGAVRSEERRVGKECRSWWSASHLKNIEVEKKRSKMGFM